MTTRTNVSVVIPTFNRSGPLLRLLNALEPHAEALEVIVVDDGSTDDTAAMLSSHPWVRSVRQDNLGPAAARNRGWQMATASIVAFTDDDCIPHDGWPFGLVAAFDDPSVGGVGGTIRPQADSWLGRFVVAERQVDHGRELDDTVDYVVTANAAFRRSALDACEGFDERFPRAAGEDVDLSWRMRAAGWRLVLDLGCAVAHDHRATVGGVMRTYYKHGEARARLRLQHPADSLGAAAGRAVSLPTMSQRWRTYRAAGSSAVGSLAYSTLRLAGLGFYVGGLAGGRRELDASAAYTYG